MRSGERKDLSPGPLLVLWSGSAFQELGSRLRTFLLDSNTRRLCSPPSYLSQVTVAESALLVLSGGCLSLTGMSMAALAILQIFTSQGQSFLLWPHSARVPRDSTLLMAPFSPALTLVLSGSTKLGPPVQSFCDCAVKLQVTLRTS